MMIKVDPKPGWAVIDRDGINVRTISVTRRAAIVNWLCVEKGLLATFLTTDDEIAAKWAHLSGEAFCTEVEISLTR